MENYILTVLNFPFLFLLLFLINNHNSQLISLIGNLQLSNETQNLVNNYQISPLGLSKVQKTSSEKFLSDKNVTFIAKMLSSNGDIGVSFQKLQGIIYKNKIIHQKDYRIT